MNAARLLLLRLLSEQEAEILEGDIAELGLSRRQAFFEIAGVLIRRWMQLLRDWKAWLIAAAFLVLICRPLFHQFLPLLDAPVRFWATYLRHGALYETGLSFQQDVCIWIGQLLLLIAFSWTGGYILAGVGRKHFHGTVLLIGVAFVAVWLWLALRFGRIPILLTCYSVPLLLPVLMGARWRLRHGNARMLTATGLAIFTFSLIALQAWMDGWFQEAMLASGGDISWLHVTSWYQRLQPWLIVSLPAFWIAVEACVKARRSKVL